MYGSVRHRILGQIFYDRGYPYHSFFNSHSIYDSYMVLIEADGKRIWHTGDYRDHGYLGKGLYPTLHRYASNIDLLITEGTTLKRGDLCIQESEVSRRMACVMSAFKYVIVLASATDIERLASVKRQLSKLVRDYTTLVE